MLRPELKRTSLMSHDEITMLERGLTKGVLGRDLTIATPEPGWSPHKLEPAVCTDPASPLLFQDAVCSGCEHSKQTGQRDSPLSSEHCRHGDPWQAEFGVRRLEMAPSITRLRE